MGYRTEHDDRPLCLECGEEIEYGRHDRKFCCQECKNRYHNRQHHYRRTVHLRIIGILNKNYEILNRLLMADVTSINLGDLSQMGYNPGFVTSCRKVRGHEECRCFDIRYFSTATRIFNIERVRLDY